MTPKPTTTELMPMNSSFTDTITVPVEYSPEDSSMHLPLDRELLDMPNIIPEMEEMDEFFYWYDLSG